jgi:hypothetical protein
MLTIVLTLKTNPNTKDIGRAKRKFRTGIEYVNFIYRCLLPILALFSPFLGSLWIRPRMSCPPGQSLIRIKAKLQIRMQFS